MRIKKKTCEISIIGLDSFIMVFMARKMKSIIFHIPSTDKFSHYFQIFDLIFMIFSPYDKKKCTGTHNMKPMPKCSSRCSELRMLWLRASFSVLIAIFLAWNGHVIMWIKMKSYIWSEWKCEKWAEWEKRNDFFERPIKVTHCIKKIFLLIWLKLYII